MALSRRAAAALLAAALLTPAGAHARAENTAIAAIAQSPDVQRALDFIVSQDEQAIRDLIELTEIPAPPFGEAARGARFAEMLRAAGLADVSIDEAGNVIARRRGRGRGPTIALIAHLDTVFPIETDLTVRIEGDTYRAPGIGDNTRGLVYLLLVARAMAHANLQTRGDVLFVGSVGEEGLGDLRGVKHLFRRGGPRIDAALVVDGGEPNRLVTSAVGSIRYRVHVRGPGGHSYGAFGLANPHHALGRIIARFDEAAAALTSGDGPRATYNVGRIGGGTSVNSIPFESWMEVDMRSTDADRLNGLDQALKTASEAGLAEENQARTRGPALTLELESVGVRPAGTSDPNSALVRNAVAAMTHFGLTPEFEASSTDANVPISLGIPAITVSRGGVSGGAHALDEWWRNENSHLAPQIGLLIVLAQARPA